MINKNEVKNDLIKYAAHMETLAHSLQEKLEKDEDPLTVAHELVASSAKLTFSLGGMYAIEQASKKKATKAVAATVVSNPSGTPVKHNYYNVRDSLGRFAKV